MQLLILPANAFVSRFKYLVRISSSSKPVNCSHAIVVVDRETETTTHGQVSSALDTGIALALSGVIDGLKLGRYTMRERGTLFGT